ncbi:MAG: LptF/LptG family permease [Simkania sp.]|nr:LptF/LptG family permease [Simkania sp.]
MRTIWQRYLYSEILKITALFLLCFFLLFVTIDYSVHMQGFLRSQSLGLFSIVIYYSYLFIKHCDLLLPLALMVATIKVLKGMNRQNELLALQAAGLPLKHLMRPFLIVALLATALNFAVAQYLLPVSLQFTDTFQDKHLKRSSSEDRANRIRVLELKDSSKLAFERFDRKTSTFHDLFWIRSIDDIWRIKQLKIDQEHPQEAPLGHFVDHIQRASDGGLHKVASYSTLRLEPLKAGAYQLKKMNIPAESLSLSKLAKELKQKNHYAQISAILAMKSVRPFLCLLAVLSIAPFCLRFTRLSSSLPLYAGGIFGIITCFIAIQAGGILTENQVLPSLISVVLPTASLMSWSIFRFAKL